MLYSADNCKSLNMKNSTDYDLSVISDHIISIYSFRREHAVHDSLDWLIGLVGLVCY